MKVIQDGLSEVRLRLHGEDSHQAAATDREERGALWAGQEKMFERHGIEISRKTMGGWMAQCAELLDPLYELMKKELLPS